MGSTGSTTPNSTALTLNNATQTVGSLSSSFAAPTGTASQTITLNGTALTINQTTTGTYGTGNVFTETSTIAGTGSVALSSSSTSTLTLTGANTYSGGTTLNGGVLAANAASAFTSGSLTSSSTGTGTVNVNSGGTLAGTGGTGPVVVNSGGTITAGAGATSTSTPGVLSTTAQTWNSGGTYVWKLNLSPSTAYSTSSVNSVNNSSGNMDALLMSALTINSTSMSQFDISVVEQNSGTLTPGTQFAIANVSSTTNNYSGSSAFNVTAGFTLSEEADSTLGSAELDGGTTGSEDLILTYTPTPEPTSAILLGAAVVPLLFERRRRRAEQPATNG
jgi:autotransporter-associated beta strand protein